MKNYYVLDMEWNTASFGMNNGKGNILKNEIIQIGLVKLEENQITDQLQVNVWPSVMGFVSKRIEKLTNLTYRSLRKERNFPFALQLFCNFIGDFEDAVLFTWDTKDLNVLKENCDFWEIPVDLEKITYVDLQSSIAKKHFRVNREEKVWERLWNILELFPKGRPITHW